MKIYKNKLRAGRHCCWPYALFSCCSSCFIVVAQLYELLYGFGQT